MFCLLGDQRGEAIAQNRSGTPPNPLSTLVHSVHEVRVGATWLVPSRPLALVISFAAMGRVSVAFHTASSRHTHALPPQHPVSAATHVHRSVRRRCLGEG